MSISGASPGPLINIPRVTYQCTAAAQGQILLAALESFIKPIVVAHGSLSNDDSNVNDESVHTHTICEDTCSAGANLLHALQEFIRLTITHAAEGTTQDDTSLEIIGYSTSPSSTLYVVEDYPQDNLTAYDNQYLSIMKTESLPTVPRFIQHHTELLPDQMETLRKIVFNDMPIRLLAFDSNGTGIELLEREEILQRCARAFQKTSGGAQLSWFGTIRDIAATRYAILSHTWIRDTPGELLYKDWDSRHLNYGGYNKIMNFCRVSAQNHGINFAWVDTVCINKDSSSELDESLRSMYKWYRKADICITYLANTSVIDDMANDLWFTRGWTLQELLAPRYTHFYNKDWNGFGLIGSVDTIVWQIEKATTITRQELDKFQQGLLDKVPLSRRMQLAAKRRVTREEDTAYSLMGILGVEIPISYGEGRQKAFFRLVRELMSVKKHFIDLFNCAYFPRNYWHPLRSLYEQQEVPFTLIPSDVSQYLGRSTAFDYKDHSGHVASRLQTFQPIEPIILTHVGIKMPLLLVPGLLTYPTNQYEGYGDFFGTAQIPNNMGSSWTSGKIYYLLHKKIFNSPTPLSSSSGPPEIATFGVINFEMDSNDSTIILPKQHCLSIPLNCGDKVGNVSPSDPVSILQVRSTGPTVFHIESRTSLNIRSKEMRKVNPDGRIPKDKLGKHGLQLITLFL